MDAPAFMPYDSRNAQPPPPQVQQRQMAPAPQYVVGPAYTAAPMQAMPAPHYQQHNAFAYVPYQSPPPTTPVGSPFRTEYQERPLPQSDHNRVAMFRRDSKHIHDLSHSSPSTRRQSVASVASTSTNPNANAKTITFNETIDPAHRVNFETDVDELMKAIQKKDEENAEVAQGPTPAATPQADGSASPSSPASSCHTSATVSTDNKPKKKWVCDGPNCNKSFVQKTHLDIHRRTHNGAKPYVRITPPNNYVYGLLTAIAIGLLKAQLWSYVFSARKLEDSHAPPHWGEAIRLPPVR